MSHAELSKVGEFEPVRRVYGIEAELLTPSELKCYGDGTHGGKTLHGIDRTGSFLSNGARLYLDVGQHIEYSAPESCTVREAVAALVAGEVLLQRATTAAGYSVKRNSEDSVTAFNMRVIDDEMNTWGSHESYLTERRMDPKQSSVYLPLASFIATRSLFSGVGVHVLGAEEDNSYSIAQKIRGIQELVSGTTTKTKPLVNTRDEPLAEKLKYRRLHLIAGDPTQSPWATAYRLGATSLVLRMLEHGMDLSDYIFANPLLASRAASEFTGLHHELDLINGKKTNVMDHQFELAELAMRFVEVVAVPEDEKIVAGEWYQAAKDFRDHDDFEVLSDRVDWAAKLSLIRKKQVQRGDLPKSKIARSIDLMYGELSPRGLALKLRERGHFRDPLRAVDIAADLEMKPPEGRASLRGALVTRLARLRRRSLIENVHVDWGYGSWKLKAQDATNVVQMKNPYGDDVDEIVRAEEHFAEIDRLVA